MLTKYGDFKFTYQGETYNGRPSFEAIASIGTPEQIVETAKIVCSKLGYVSTYREAFDLVQRCSDKPLPKKWEPKLYMSKDMKLIPNYIDDDVKVFIITMARHCIEHGISGKVDNDGDLIMGDDGDDKEVLLSFDPYDYIISAIATLGLSMSEAANLTMTEYIARVRATPEWIRANKDRKKRVDKKRDKKAIDWWEEIKRKDRERAAK